MDQKQVVPISLHGIKNIIFDFGGVLFDIDYQAPARAFEELGVGNFAEIYAKKNQNPLFDLLETGKVTKAEFLVQLRALTRKDLSDEQLLWAWNIILLDIPKERIDHIYKVKEAGYRTFLLSNTNAIHAAEFEKTIDKRMGLDYFRAAFEKTYYSHDLGMRKPHAEVYLHLCGVHDLKPEETLFIDDSPQHVAGAKEAGLHAYHFRVGLDEVAALLKVD